MDATKQQDAPKDILISVEFSGGLEILFGGKRKHEILLPLRDNTGQDMNVNYLVNHLCEHTMTEDRREMFVVDGIVRPGILVLINDADWELEGEGMHKIKPGDNILFVSTLHGG